MKLYCRWMTVCLVGLLSSSAAVAADWPQFRGPLGTGVSTETTAPLQWDAETNIRWRAELPAPGNSSPVVSAGRVFVTVATDEGRQRHLLCFDRESGEQLWQATAEFSGDEPTHETNPPCSSTPAADGERVVVWQGSAGLFCYDYEGRELWSRDLGSFRHIWGNGSSPIIVGDTVVLNCGPGPRSFVLAVDINTGSPLWQTDEPGGATGLEDDVSEGEAPAWIGSWSTPVLARIDGNPQILVSMPHHVQAYDLSTGEILWRCDGLGDLVYTSVLLGDGVAVAMGGYHGPAIGFRLGGTGNVTESNRLWLNDKRNPQRIGSGVVVGPHIFMANEPGIMECIEVESGEQLWRSRLPGGRLWGSLIKVGDRFYVTNQRGDTIVMAVNPAKLEILATNSLGEPSNATPAVSDGELFLRTFEALYCIAD